MTQYKKYSEFLLEEEKYKDMFSFVLSDIHIHVDVIINELKEKYNMSCWYLYNNQNSVSLEYFQSSDSSPKNIMNIKKFFFDKLPYFRDLAWYEDDRRMVLKFVEPGDPVRFKFYH